ncbi:MAG TPA: zinc-dependent metalloprotease family protein [Patescibacteria group bacterium]|nr:zinc-dependent metalloprotease family protein [Patescibacteria group bacterium]
MGAALLLAASFAQAAEPTQRLNTDPNGFWVDIDVNAPQRAGEPWVTPAVSRAVLLDVPALDALVRRAPMEFSSNAPQAIRLALPLPDGGFSEFEIVESPVMEPDLAAKFPSIRTYSGRGINDPHARVRLDVTPLGFHAQVLAPDGDYLIDPMLKDDITHYLSYFRRDYGENTKQYRCETHDHGLTTTTESSTAPTVGKLGTPNTVGTQLRTLRTAIVATSSYTNIFGGTVSSGLSGLTTLVNRLNGVYERDLSVRLVLVANNDLIVYTNDNVGPIGAAPSGPDTIIQTTIDNAIGFANYDLGHAVGGTGGGGAITPLGNVCTASKARGFTSLGPPRGDIFDIDFVAHELGHQLGANHTWFGCGGGGQWTQSSAMEPGSGSTIMAYAGICSDNLQPNSDAYFHARSFTQIVTRLALDETGTPPTCGSNIATGNSAPNISALAAMTIPEQTPFQLTAIGTDGDGDTITYNWEETDTGTPSAAPSSTGDNGTAPLFRSFNASTSPTRVFPSLPYILDNGNAPPLTMPMPPAAGSFYSGEILPNPASGTRVMNFRVTARDNRAAGGGVAFAASQVTATSAAGPFSVSNIAGPLTGGATHAVTWNVANTTAAPVSTSLVNLLISLDGGYTFSTLLAGTANDGSETVTIPNVATTRARIKVEAANGTGISTGNTYFDITNSNFAISASGTGITVTPTANAIVTKQGSPAPAAVQIATIAGGTPPYTLAAAAFPETMEVDIVALSEAAGAVSASAEVSCQLAAPNAPNFRIYPAVLQVTDSAGRTGSGVFAIQLSNNDIPSIGTYANQALGTGNSVVVSPSALPTDTNGNFVGVSVSPTTLPGGGTVSIDPVTAAVTIQTAPLTTLGIHKIRVLATDTCGATAVQQFTVTVTTLDPVLQYNGVAVTTPSNAVIEPNECNTLDITLGNVGGSTASSISTTLSSSTPGVDIATAASPYGDIATNGSGINTIAYEVGTEASVPCGSEVDFTQTVTFNGPSSPLTFNFSLPVGQPPAQNYTFASGSAAGSMAGGTLVAGSQEDDTRVAVSAFPAGFAFSIYGTPVTSLFADTNGALLFNSLGGTSTASNGALPAGAFAAPALIGFWDDLDMRSAATTGGGIYTQVNGIAPNRTFDIEWRARRFNNSGSGAPTVQFMMRLHETSNLMEIYYTDVSGNNGGGSGSSATVGVQQAAPAGTVFTQYSNNSAALSAGQRLTLTRAPGVCVVGPGTCFDPNAIFKNGFE